MRNKLSHFFLYDPSNPSHIRRCSCGHVNSCVHFCFLQSFPIFCPCCSLSSPLLQSLVHGFKIYWNTWPSLRINWEFHRASHFCTHALSWCMAHRRHSLEGNKEEKMIGQKREKSKEGRSGDREGDEYEWMLIFFSDSMPFPWICFCQCHSKHVGILSDHGLIGLWALWPENWVYWCTLRLCVCSHPLPPGYALVASWFGSRAGAGTQVVWRGMQVSQVVT